VIAVLPAQTIAGVAAKIRRDYGAMPEARDIQSLAPRQARLVASIIRDVAALRTSDSRKEEVAAPLPYGSRKRPDASDTQFQRRATEAMPPTDRVVGHVDRVHFTGVWFESSTFPLRAPAALSAR
jgi:hypothetical protein